MSNYKDKINKFSNLMERELNANKHKGEWKDLHPLYLISELYYHVSKLHKAVENEDLEKTKEYSADCGNIAMMILDVTKNK